MMLEKNQLAINHGYKNELYDLVWIIIVKTK